MRRLYYEAGFKSICLEDTILIGLDPTKSGSSGELVKMHHMPYAGDHGVERYLQWRPKDEGHWLLHGHVHEKWKTKGRMINVGVDVWDFYPVSLDQIKELITK